MPIKLYNQTNFHRYTFCVFQEVVEQDIQGLSLSYRSKSGSEYYFTKEGVFRKSNHWGRAANCKWRLTPLENTLANRTKIGYAAWTSFYPDNEHEKLYFIQYDPSTKQVNYFHKDQDLQLNDSLLRTANEATKSVKIIRNLIQEPAWLDYFPNQNKEAVLQFVCEQVCTTSKSVFQIKALAQQQIL
jgi:hypothetical protein